MLNETRGQFHVLAFIAYHPASVGILPPFPQLWELQLEKPSMRGVSSIFCWFLLLKTKRVDYLGVQFKLTYVYIYILCIYIYYVYIYYVYIYIYIMYIYIYVYIYYVYIYIYYVYIYYVYIYIMYIYICIRIYPRSWLIWPLYELWCTPQAPSAHNPGMIEHQFAIYWCLMRREWGNNPWNNP